MTCFKKEVVFFTFFPFFNGQISNLISILIWTFPDRQPWDFFERGYEPFKNRNCTFQNCFLTQNRSLFDVTYFDVVLFNAVDLYLNGSHFTDIPQYRTDMQEYVLVSTEPSGRYPLTSKFNSFFNMTWTYKLNSDVVFPYFIVKNSRGEIIGPKRKMNWDYEFRNKDPPTSVVSKLWGKKIAAVVFLNNCWANHGGRMYYLRVLQSELSKLGQDLHIFGDCGYMRCGSTEECYGKIQTDYYFFLAFENSYCDDYVSEKVLHGLQNYAVPVVLGSANYTRFMPDGIYLNADIGPPKLANQMIELINDTSRYRDFFKWHGHYSFHHVREENFHDTVCDFCALLNNQTRREQHAFYKEMDKWWNGHRVPAIQEFVLDSDGPDEDLPVKDEGFIGNIVNGIYKLFSGEL